MAKVQCDQLRKGPRKAEEAPFVAEAILRNELPQANQACQVIQLTTVQHSLCDFEAGQLSQQIQVWDTCRTSNQ